MRAMDDWKVAVMAVEMECLLVASKVACSVDSWEHCWADWTDASTVAHLAARWDVY